MTLDDRSFKLLQEDEGRKDENVKGDPGGRTFVGIDMKDDAAWDGWPLVDQAEAEGRDPAQDLGVMARVRAFYEQEWDSFKVDALPPLLRTPFFGACVNEGPGRATMLLQQAVNTIAGTAKVKVDGILGDGTIMALVDLNLPGVAAQFWVNRSTRYTDDSHQGHADDLQGWQDRLISGL